MALAVKKPADVVTLFTSSVHSRAEPVENASTRSLQATPAEQPKPKKRQPTYSRLIALVLGVFSLAAALFGLYSFLDHTGIRLRRPPIPAESLVSMVEVEAMNVTESCWMVFHGIVYDLTEYEHPGGNRLIHGKCGKDATRAFDANHPLAYLPQITKFALGRIREEEPVASPTLLPTGRPSPLPQQSASSRLETKVPTAALTADPTTAPTIAPTAHRFQIIVSAELAKHSTPQDCWLAIHGNVYNLTAYAPRHPGGRTLITEFCGTEATTMFKLHHEESTLRVVQGSLIAPFAGLTEPPSVSPVSQPPSMTPTVALPSSMPTALQTEVVNITKVEPSLSEESNAPELPGNTTSMTTLVDYNATSSTAAEPSSPPVTSSAFSSILTNLERLANETLNTSPIPPEVNPITQALILSTVAPSTRLESTTPTMRPSRASTNVPTAAPMRIPTDAPTSTPTEDPTRFPTERPTRTPTQSPTKRPTKLPTKTPTQTPTVIADVESSGSCISIRQVEMHNAVEDCYMVLYNQVFDFTEYADIHPGGDEWITDYCGIDATTEFESAKKHDAKLLSKKGGYSYLLADLCTE